MKRKVILSFLLILLIGSLVFGATSFIVEEEVIFRTTGGAWGDADYTMGADFDFYKVELNSTHLWMDKSYSSKHYTRYCIYLASENDTEFTVNTWFATINSSATLSIVSPSAEDIDMGFSSPNLVSATVTGEVPGTESWNADTKTLTFTVNTSTSLTFIINVTVTETEYNDFDPENIEVEVMDFEGCGNWVFQGAKYYTFQAIFWDGDGYADLDTMKIKFSDGLTDIIAIYDRIEGQYSLESGEDVVNLKHGSISILSSNTLQVTWLIYFESKILDALDVDLYVWCNDTYGANTGWELMEEDYINIYNFGGQDLGSLTTTGAPGDAGRLTGGDVFDFYARNGSSVEASIIYRNLQHVKLLSDVFFNIGHEGANITYGMDYCLIDSDDFIEGWRVDIETLGAVFEANKVWFDWRAHWYNRGEWIKSENLSSSHGPGAAHEANTTSRLWIDLWFNTINGSTTIGARVNAYEYPMTDTSPWWQRLFFSTWGVDQRYGQTKTLFADLLDESGNTISTQQIKLVRLKVKLLVYDDLNEPTYFTLTHPQTFDKTFCPINQPFQGVQTPAIDETLVPTMTQRGFFGALWSSIRWLADQIWRALGPSGLDLWGLFAGAMDTLFTWAGWPGGFTQIVNTVLSAVAWFGVALVMLIDWMGILIPIVQGMTDNVGSLLLVLGQMITSIFMVIPLTLYWLNEAIVESGLGELFYAALVLFSICLPLLEAKRMEDNKGFSTLFADLEQVINIGAFLINFGLKFVNFLIDLVLKLISAIPGI